MTAATLAEQIEKRGDHGWIEPLIKELGTWLLLQLGDMANLLEVILKCVSLPSRATTIALRKLLRLNPSLLAKITKKLPSFYEWREPVRTAYTLSFFAAGCLAFSLTPVWLLVKISTLSAGLVFFGLFPIGSRYPDYRLLASPATWLFWNIPNHGKLSRCHTVSDDTRTVSD